MVKATNTVIVAVLLLAIGLLMIAFNSFGHQLHTTGLWLTGIGGVLLVASYGYQVFIEGCPAFSPDPF